MIDDVLDLVNAQRLTYIYVDLHLQSRENSLLSPNPSWLTSGGVGGNTPSPKEESAAANPPSTTTLPSHPLAAMLQQPSPHPSSSKKSIPPIPPSSSVQRPPLPPPNDVNSSLLSDSGEEVSRKQQFLDLISEESSPDRSRAATTGSEDALHKRNNSLLPPSGSIHAISSMLPKLTEDDGCIETSDGCEDNSNTMDEIQKTHFVRVSFVVPISDRSLSSIKSGARTQVSLLRRGKYFDFIALTMFIDCITLNFDTVSLTLKWPICTK